MARGRKKKASAPQLENETRIGAGVRLFTRPKTKEEMRTPPPKTDLQEHEDVKREAEGIAPEGEHPRKGKRTSR